MNVLHLPCIPDLEPCNFLLVPKLNTALKSWFSAFKMTWTKSRDSPRLKQRASRNASNGGVIAGLYGGRRILLWRGQHWLQGRYYGDKNSVQRHHICLYFCYKATAHPPYHWSWSTHSTDSVHGHKFVPVILTALRNAYANVTSMNICIRNVSLCII